MIAQRYLPVLLFLILISAASAASESQFAIKESHTDSYGVTIQTVGGTVDGGTSEDRVNFL